MAFDEKRDNIICHHMFAMTPYHSVEMLMPIMKVALCACSIFAAGNVFLVCCFSSACCLLNTCLAYFTRLYVSAFTNKLRFALNASVLWINIVGLLVSLQQTQTLSSTSTYCGLATPLVCIFILILPRGFIPSAREQTPGDEEENEQVKAKNQQEKKNSLLKDQRSSTLHLNTGEENKSRPIPRKEAWTAATPVAPHDLAG